MGTVNKPQVGSTVTYRGDRVVIVRYPTHNLDSLEGMVMVRRVDGKRAFRAQLAEVTA